MNSFTQQEHLELERKALSLSSTLTSLSPRNETTKESHEQARIQALETAKGLVSALERPEDIVIRYAFMSLHGMCIRIGLEMGLYEIIQACAGKTFSAGELTEILTHRLEKTTFNGPNGNEDTLGALLDERQDLLVRVLRVLTAIGFINEEDTETYSANGVTQKMTESKYAAMIRHCFDVVLPASTSTPAYLTKNQFTLPSSTSLTPFQNHYSHPNPPSSYFGWLAANPALNANFNTYMQGSRLSRPFWGDWFPVQDRLLKELQQQEGNEGAHGILMVDVGGGLGHDLVSFKQRFPDAVIGTDAKLLLQDQKHVIEEVERSGGLGEGIRCEVYDFFKPQPIIGARIYFYRFILHDWDDASCRQILANTAAAMKPGYSKLILNEIVLPDKRAPLQMALWDMQMMVVLGGRERTERAWRQLLESVGLEVVGIWQPPGAMGGGWGGEGIIEAVLKA